MIRAGDPAAIERISAQAVRIPTPEPEADGTLDWEATTLVLVNVHAAGQAGLGYTYGASACVPLLGELLAPVLIGADADNIPARWNDMVRAVRNAGRAGVAACAISAIDVALWDLKAKRLDTPLHRLLGHAREQVPAYGSGGFTSMAVDALCDQLAGWEEDGCGAVKMKVGGTLSQVEQRLEEVARRLHQSRLMVDANGAYDCADAMRLAATCRDLQIVWLEEPVSSDDLGALARIRRCGRSELRIAAGEYGYDPWYFAAMLGAGAVDVLQADATRCLGYTGFLRAAGLADAVQTPLSTHCAPALHLPVALAVPRLMHMEWFIDHVRIEQAIFEGAPVLQDGCLAPNDGPGHGLVLREDSLNAMGRALQFAAWGARS